LILTSEETLSECCVPEDPASSRSQSQETPMRTTNLRLIWDYL